MSEWHLPPDYIVSNWTDELLDLMIEKMVERKKVVQPGEHKVSSEELSARSHGMIKVVKRGDKCR